MVPGPGWQSEAGVGKGQVPGGDRARLTAEAAVFAHRLLGVTAHKSSFF